MKYAVEFRPRATKELAALPKSIRSTIANVIETLADNPRPAGAVTLRGTDFLRVRVGDYRIIYEVRHKVLLVLVIRIGHRRDVYRPIDR